MSTIENPTPKEADLIKILIAVIFPPLGVYLETGLSKHLVINIVLTMLGFLPGILHALYIILKF